MTEPFYGSVANSPIWSGLAPTFGFVQSPTGAGVSHGEGFGSPLIPQAPLAGLPAVGAGFPMGSAVPVPGAPHPGYIATPQAFAPAGGYIPQAFGGSPFGQPGFVQGPGPFHPVGAYASISAFEGGPGVTAPALLAIIAMRRGQPQGPASDQEIEEFIYDALELLPGTNDVEVRVEGGRVTITGSVQQKRLKRDVGEIGWAIPSVNDVVNTVTIATRRRSRSSGREEPHPPSSGGRKQG